MIRQNREIVGGLFWFVVALAYFVGSIKNGLILRGVPGPGFLPFLCSMALMIMAGYIVIREIVRRQKVENDVEPFSKAGLIRIVLALVALFGYGFLLPYFGFLIITFLFMLLTLRILEPRSWKFTISVSLIVAIVAQVLFVVVLGVSLPKSPLGIF